MKNFQDKVELIIALEKDAPENILGMQMKVWKLYRGTVVLVRLFHPRPKTDVSPWDPKMTWGAIHDYVLAFLKDLGVIKDVAHWAHSVDATIKLEAEDEFEDKESSYYFAYVVPPTLLRF